MTPEPIAGEVRGRTVWLTFARAEERNPINAEFLAELNRWLDRAEREPRVTTLVLRADGPHFSSGMDFHALVERLAGETAQASGRVRREALALCEQYLDTLQRLTRSTRVVVCEVRGNVVGGGVGILAASDLVVSSPKPQFRLPEIVWGLIPAMVLPFLIRRVGPRAAYKLVLTGAPISAATALDLQLVDEVDPEPSAAVQRLLAKLERADPAGIRRLKRYFEQVDSWDPAALRATAQTTASLIVDPEVRRKIDNFVHRKVMPWEDVADRVPGSSSEA